MEIINNQLDNSSPDFGILPKQKKPWYKKWWLIVIILLLVYLLGGWFLAWRASKNVISSGEISTENQNKVEEQKLFLNTDSDPQLGSPDGLVRIVEFADFQCPYCQESFLVTREILSRYGDDIYFVYRDFPVTDSHPESAKAAEAGQCANEQGKFWSYHDKLFINQENLSLSDLKRYAIEVGLESQQFNDCLDSGKYEQEISQDYLDGINLGVFGTPTFFINGYRISGSIPLEIFEVLVEQAKLEG